MNIAKLTTAAILAGVSVIPSSAEAALLLFNLSGGRNVTFQLDSNPTPNSSQSFLGEQAVFTNLSGTINGTPGTIDTVSFGSGVFAILSITATDLDFTQFASGGPLFTGPGSAPVFAPGTFQFTNPFFPSSNSTLVISAAGVGGAVPEPTTWAMLILGFGAVGFGMRRSKGQAKLSYA